MKISLFSTLFLSIFALGCGGSGGEVSVRGKIHRGGTPLNVDAGKLPPGDKGISIIFISQEKAGEEASAIVDLSAGTFTVPGPQGHGIKPGRYKIAITLGPMGRPDELKGAFSREKTQIIREVKSGEEIVIDLAKPTG